MTIWIHSMVNRNCLQASEPLHSLPNRLLDAIYNVVDIIVSYVWAGRETEAYLEESGFHVVGVDCGTCVNRLLVHWLPDRTSLDFLCEHEHAESLHIFVRLTIGRRTIYGVNHTCSTAHCGLDDLLVGLFLTLNVNGRVQCRCAEPEIRIIARIRRLLMDMNTRHIGQQFLIKLLHMLMMLDMRIENSHLAATDTCANIGHTIVVADGSMLVVRIGITRLCRIPHDLIGIFSIAANKSAAAGSRDHLVAVERQYAVLAESSENLAVKARTHALCGILDNLNTVFVCNSHDLVNLVRHTIESHWDNRLRIFARFFFSVNDCLFKKRRIHIPRLRLQTDKHRFCAEIGYRMRRCAECERLYTNLVTGAHSLPIVHD